MLTPVSRAVLRVPTPSATWARTAVAVVGASRAPNRGVPLRSENRALQVEHRSIRRVFPGPYREVTVRLPCPRFPWSGHARF